MQASTLPIYLSLSLRAALCLEPLARMVAPFLLLLQFECAGWAMGYFSLRRLCVCVCVVRVCGLCVCVWLALLLLSLVVVGGGGGAGLTAYLARVSVSLVGLKRFELSVGRVNDGQCVPDRFAFSMV